MKHLWIKAVLLGLFAQTFIACGTAQPALQGKPAAEYTSSTITAWHRFIPTLITATPGWTPPVVSRAYAYFGIATYEAVVPGMPDYQSLAAQLNGLQALPTPKSGTAYHWPTAAHHALATLVRLFFQQAPEHIQQQIEQFETQQSQTLKAQIDPAIYDRSATWGQSIGLAIYTWSLDDQGYAAQNFPQDYQVAIGDGLWEPTNSNLKYPLQPHWGHNRTFALENGAECLPPPPPTYSHDPNSTFYKEAFEVYTTVNNITPEQREIALFWADDPGLTSTPPGHSVSILTTILESKQASLEQTVLAYAQLGMAVADAFISGWHAKYAYNLVRPITFIHKHFDPNWRTIVSTPPFPEYPSGHSVQAGAAAIVLTDLFGELAFQDSTHTERGLNPRSFTSFDAMAQEAAISRLYGGIHFRAAIEKGLDQGRCVGTQVLELEYLR